MNLKLPSTKHLKNDPTIVGIVVGRIYRSHLHPQGQSFRFSHTNELQAQTKTISILSLSGFQFDLVGKLEDDDQVEELKEAVIDCLNRFKVTLAGQASKVKIVWLDIVVDDFIEDHSGTSDRTGFLAAYLRNEI